ncbi:alpha/beta hydrolase family protein [Streptomyces lavendofoliae]|uniref:Peptide hydrolase n=1 Tax=Streptomyces lavendofoliae TaxID=67314 RepID=A0A918M5B8_9ACTN|nr:alpha/beta fold hydrolase [Streptomyces lavendofoliae]GGU47951.1 peptide hydrolase [Streptomyces lavendofoliae]
MTGGYRVYRAALPEVCAADPARMVFTADADGRCEVFTWDAVTRRARQVTRRPRGTLHGAIDREAHVWWFDEDAHGRGHWRFQPFAGGPDLPGLSGVPSGLPRGLAVSDHGTVALAVGHGGTTSVHLGPRGGAARTVAHTDGHATLTGITPRGHLLAVGRADGVTVLTSGGTVRAVLPGGDRSGRLWALGFAPAGPDEELLLVRERDDRYVVETWRPGTGTVTHDWCAFDTEITARWDADGRSVLVRQDRHGRSALRRARLDDRTLTTVPTPAGTLLDAATRRGGDLHYLWTDTAHPPRLCSSRGTPLPPLPTVTDPVPGTHRDLWTPGPEGPVHTLLSLPGQPASLTEPTTPTTPALHGPTGPAIPTGPAGATARPGTPAPAPAPAVFLVHGGPADHDRDAYDGVVHSLVASGFAVARVNYRGSTGYGPRWRRASGLGVGLAQVDDLVSVRADLVGRRLIRPDAVGLWGTSWGGYLVLLALGTCPDLWRAGVAVKPVADCAAAYATTTPALRALDERLFGGTPDEVPDRYARSSPIQYVTAVRAPLLVAAATHDAKCPPGQVRGYLAALRAAGVRHEAMWLDSGHDGYDGGDHVAVLRRAVVFLDRELRGPARRPQTPRSTRSGEHRTTERTTERRRSHAEGRHSQRPARG